MRTPRQSWILILLAVAGLLVLVTGCDRGDLSTPTDTPQSVGGKADGEEEAPTPPDISGAWAVAVQSEVESRDTQTGETSTSTVIVLALLNVSQEEADVTLKVKTCRAYLPQVSGYQPEIKDSVMQSLPRTTAQGVVSSDDEGNWYLTTEPAAVLAGVKLTNPTTDPIPTSGSSSKVVDQDQDGYPGVSVTISGFKVYGAIRVVFVLDGEVQETGVSGGADLKQSFVIYGDNVPFVDVAAKVAAAAETTEVVSKTDSFRMVRLEEEEPGCAEVLADGVLFNY